MPALRSKSSGRKRSSAGADARGAGGLTKRTRAGLSKQEESFALAIVCGSTALGAYEAAYGWRSTPGATSYQSRKNKASEVYRRPVVQARIAELRERAAGEAVDVLADHLESLADLRDIAVDAGDLGSATRCEELRGRALGLYVERRMIASARMPVDAPPRAKSTAEWLRSLDTLSPLLPTTTKPN